MAIVSFLTPTNLFSPYSFFYSFYTPDTPHVQLLIVYTAYNFMDLHLM